MISLYRKRSRTQLAGWFPRQLGFAGIFVLFCLPSIAVAQPNYFWNGSSGSFADSNKWSFGVTTPAGPPAAGDRALFLSGSGFTVSGNGSPAQVVVQVSLATFTGVISPQGNVTGFPTLITGFDVGVSAVGRASFSGSGAALNSARPITVGDSAEGTLIFGQGATGSATGTSTSAAVSIAGNPAGIGHMLIGGANTSFTANGTFNLGGRGIGDLSVTVDGSLNTNGDLANNAAGLNIGGAIPGATGAQGRMFIAAGGTVHNELQTNIGLYGKGTVDIEGGTFTSTDGGTNNPAISIARFDGSEGHLNVSGTGHVISEGELIVGGGDTGTMTITDQGLVETFARVAVPAIVGFGSTADGLVTVNGPDAQWTVTDALVVGQLTTGKINLINGGTLFVERTDFVNDPYINIGDDAGSDGLVTVSNANSFFDASLITTNIGLDQFSHGRLEITDLGMASLARTMIGSAGEGDLVVNTGGSLITGTSVIGEFGSSMGTATLASNGSWHVGGQLYVGDQGSGELFVGDTATLTVDEFISIGESAGSLGIMTIDGATATVNGTLSAMYIGFLGEGELHLSNEASWTLNGDVTMGEIVGGSGSAYIDATSAWNVTGGIYVGGSAVAAGGFGFIESYGSVTSDTSVVIWDDAVVSLIDGGQIRAPQVDIIGQLAGTGTVDATTTTNNGLITPDKGVTSIGKLTFSGDYVQTVDGNLNLEFGGTLPEIEYDLIEIAGAATLDGQLGVLFVDNFVPTVDDEFEIIDIMGTLTGTFAGLGEGAFVSTVGNIALFISYLGGDGNDVVLTTELSGDFDFDGDVDGRDFLLWQRGESPRPLSPDDLLAWQENYGTSILFTAAATAVPEPGALWLMLPIAFVLINELRRKRRGIKA